MVSRALVVLLAGGAFVVTALAQFSAAPTVEIINAPPLLEERTAEVGETLVSKIARKTSDAIELTAALDAKAWGYKIFLPKGSVLKASSVDGNMAYFVSGPVMAKPPMGPAQTTTVEIGLSTRASSFVEVRAMSGTKFKTKDSPKFKVIKVVDLEYPALHQELVYNGKSGDTVKFLYREFAKDLARPAFSQDVEYDLAEGNVIGFKGARIEVIEATNLSVRYKVLVHFPDPTN